VTTKDDFSREETIDYVESILTNLEETEDVYRTYVEDNTIDEADAQRLLTNMDRLDEETILSTLKAMQTLEADE
jgi:hypothetical protein